MNIDEESLIEAALLTTEQPLSARHLRQLFQPAISQDKLNDLMDNLQQRWQNRVMQLTETTQGWQFSVDANSVQNIPHLYQEKKPRYSRAVMETLAIIAYHQPITRAQIEEIRGVAVSSHIIQTLSERGWIESVGHKEVPGRPLLWATGAQFLDDLQLNSLQELPSLAGLGDVISDKDTPFRLPEDERKYRQ